MKLLQSYIKPINQESSKLSKGICFHWKIENNLLWILDHTFNEDRALGKKDNTPANFNKIAFILIEHDRVTKLLKT